MKVKQTQLAELWKGNAVYRLLLLKGHNTRFVITRQEPLADDSRAHHVATELTMMAVVKRWEELFPDDPDIEDQPQEALL